MAKIIEETLEVTKPTNGGYDNSGFSESTSNATVDPDATPPGSPPSFIGSESLEIDVTADNGVGSSKWDYGSTVDDNYVRFLFICTAESLANNKGAYVCVLEDSSNNIVAGIQFLQTGNQLYFRLGYYDSGDQNSSTVGTLSTDILYMVKFKYFTGGASSKAYELIVDYWSGSAWTSLGSTSDTFSGTPLYPQIFRFGGASQNPVTYYLDCAWWDNAAYPDDPAEIEDLSVSISDLMTIAESLSESLPLAGINVSDSMTLAENMSIDLPICPNISDSITITENLIPNLPLGINISDPIIPIEILSGNLPLAGINVSESITPIESFKNDLPLAININDSNIIQEGFGKNLPLIKSISESNILQELIKGKFSDLEISYSEILNIVENINASLPSGNLEVSVSDIMNIIESLTLNREPSEDAILAETGDFILTEDGDFILTEAGTANLFKSISDSMIITESISASLPLAGISVSESISPTESILTNLPLGISISDSNIIQESFGKNLPLSQIIQDSNILQELLKGKFSDLEINRSEIINIIENINAGLPTEVIEKNISDILNIYENIKINLPLGINTSDSIVLNDLILVSLSGIALLKKKGLLLHVY